MALPRTEEGVPEEPAAGPPPRREHDVVSDFAYVVVHETGRGTVAWLRGDLDITTAPTLLRQVIDTLNLPIESLVLDLAEVRDIDQHGLATLLVTRKRAAMRHVTLTFDGVDEDLRSAIDGSS